MTNSNPFGVSNPEDLSPEYIAKYFVDVFTDFPRLNHAENTFVHGARGTGKSMMLRRLEASVMLLAEPGKTFENLPFLGVHVPLRKIEFGITELTRPKGTTSTALGEHMLTMHVMFRLARLLKAITGPEQRQAMLELATSFAERYVDCGGNISGSAIPADGSASDLCTWIESVSEREAVAVRQHIKRLSFGNGLPYNGALTGYLDLLLPIAEHLTRASGMPHVPLFVMFDDADNLPKSMQRVLNSWVSTRSIHAICLKVSTQLSYASWRTLDGRLIESPHDFNEVDIASIYTKTKDRFSRRLHEIVALRLKHADISTAPRDFFPCDEDQKRRIDEIADAITAEWQARKASGVEGGGTKAADDVSRYAIPRFMTGLAGASKSTHTYSYAGFDSLVDLSSGVVRWFLEPAARMYDEAASDGMDPVTHIPPRVQDKVIQAWSREFTEKLLAMEAEDDVEVDADAPLSVGPDARLAEGLHNLVHGLGAFFRARLLDPDASERRAFSVVVTGSISTELAEVLNCGVRLGYLQKSDYAGKNTTTGRHPRYILARRLGPAFNLDVSGYAANLSVTAKALSIAVSDPKRFVTMRVGEEKATGGTPQLTLKLEDET